MAQDAGKPPKARYKRPWDRESQDKRKRAIRLAARTPSIYFLRCRTFIKIGWTTDIGTRLSQVRVNNPDEVTVAAFMRGGEREERVLHGAFHSLHHRAEWFKEEGALAELIRLIGGESPDEARMLAGDWFLNTFGLLTLLFDLPPAQKPDQEQRIPLINNLESNT